MLYKWIFLSFLSNLIQPRLYVNSAPRKMLCSCFVKVSIDHLFDNLEAGKRNYCFEKALEIVLNFGSKKSVRTLYKLWLLHEKSYQTGFSSHTRTEWSSAASISIVENHQPSPEAFSARSILDSTVNCDVTQRGWLESHISHSSHYMYIRLLFVSARKLSAIVWTHPWRFAGASFFEEESQSDPSAGSRAWDKGMGGAVIHTLR